MKIIRLLKSPAVKQGIVVLVDQGLMSLVTFITGVLIARSSSKEEYALYMLGWSLLLAIKGVQEALINLPFTIYAPRLSGLKLKVYQGSILLLTFIFCVIAGTSLFLADYFNAKYITSNYFELIEMAPLLVFLLTAVVFRDFLRNALLAQLNIWASVGINGAISVIVIASISYLFYINKLTPINAYLLFAIAFSIAAVLMFWQRRLQYRLDRRVFFRHLLKNWKLGKWALIGNFAYIGSRMSFPWLILYFLDYKAVAVYSACLALSLAPAPLFRGAGAYILPRMSHGYKDGSNKNLMRLLGKSILLLCPIYLLWLIIGISFSDELMSLVYSEKFNDVSFLFVLLLIMTTIDFVFAPLTSTLQVLEKTKAVTVSLIIGALVTLLLSPFFIKEYGLYGVGVLSIISMSASVAWKILALIVNNLQQKKI